MKLRPDSDTARRHSGLTGSIGMVGAIVHGRRWDRLDATDGERQRDRAARVRFAQPPVVLMLVPVDDLEAVDVFDLARTL